MIRILSGSESQGSVSGLASSIECWVWKSNLLNRLGTPEAIQLHGEWAVTAKASGLRVVSVPVCATLVHTAGHAMHPTRMRLHPQRPHHPIKVPKQIAMLALLPLESIGSARRGYKQLAIKEGPAATAQGGRAPCCRVNRNQPSQATPCQKFVRPIDCHEVPLSTVAAGLEVKHIRCHSPHHLSMHDTLQTTGVAAPKTCPCPTQKLPRNQRNKQPLPKVASYCSFDKLEQNASSAKAVENADSRHEPCTTSTRLPGSTCG